MVVGKVPWFGHHIAKQPGAQQLKVRADADPGIADVGGSLRQRERQQAKGRGERVELIVRLGTTRLCPEYRRALQQK